MLFGCVVSSWSSFGIGCDWWLVRVMSVVSRVCCTLLMGFGVLLWWFGSSCGEVFCGWVYAMLIKLLMVIGLLGIWVGMSVFVWVVVLVVIRGT